MKTPVLGNCRLCGNALEERAKEWPAYQEGTTFPIYECRTCNTSMVVAPASVEPVYNLIYKSGDRVPGYARYWRYARTVQKCKHPLQYLATESDAYWAVISTIKEYINAKDIKASVLEVGSGLGYLTAALRRDGIDAVGIDISKDAIAAAIGRFGPYYISETIEMHGDKYAGQYDIVIATEVIEHVVDPIQFSRHVVNLLKPGGIAILTTPNKEIYGPNAVWDTELPPVHLWWFSETSMKALAEHLGCRLTLVSFEKYCVPRGSFIAPSRPPQATFGSAGDLLKTEHPESMATARLKVLLRALHLSGIINRIRCRVKGGQLLIQRSHSLCAILTK